MGEQCETQTSGQVDSQMDSQTDSQASSQAHSLEQRDSKFIAAWVVLIILGIAIEFFGRLFGYESNPTPIFHTWMPLLTATLSVIVGLAGYFTLTSGMAKRSTLRKRNGALILALAAVMLVTSFAFKPVIPLIFG